MKCHYLLFIFCQLTFLYSVYLLFVVFFFISSTFFHVQYISVYKKTSIRVACVLNTSGLKRVTIKHSRVRYPKIFPVSRSGTCLLAYRQLRPCYSSLKQFQHNVQDYMYAQNWIIRSLFSGQEIIFQLCFNEIFSWPSVCQIGFTSSNAFFRIIAS